MRALKDALWGSIVEQWINFSTIKVIILQYVAAVKNVLGWGNDAKNTGH